MSPQLVAHWPRGCCARCLAGWLSVMKCVFIQATSTTQHPPHRGLRFTARSGNCTKRPPRSRCSLARLFHAPRRLCCLRSITDETQSVSSAGSADCGSTTAAFSLPPPAIELTRRLWQGSGAVSAVVQEAARGEAVRAVGAHSSSPRPMVRLVGLLRGATARRESIVASCAAGVGVNHAARHVFVRALL